MSAAQRDGEKVGDINHPQTAQEWHSRKLHYPNLDVLIQPEEYLLARLPPTSAIPPSVLQLVSQPVQAQGVGAGPLFCTVSRTQFELSILVSTSAERSWADLRDERRPPGTLDMEQGYGMDGPWRTFRIRGPMEFHLVGVLLEFTKSLAQRSISIFAISTWDTDYICVKGADFVNACQALREDGWNVLDRAN